MTAEIAIFNRSAVVVAADSAVTVGRDKVHISANKIFSVSESCPIGCMIYGTADFATIPWETIIKIFRKESLQKSFSTVRQCRDEFFEFLKGDRFITDDTASTSFVLFVVSVIEPIKDSVQKLAPSDRGKQLEAIIKKRVDWFTNHPITIQCDLPPIKNFKSARKKDIRVIANEVFDEIKYKYPTRLDDLMVDMIYAAFSSGFVSNYHSGIVFFGFGDDDLLPKLTRDELDGAPFKRLRIKEGPVEDDDDFVDEPAIIFPFADTEVMTSFMEGTTKAMKTTFMGLLYKTSNEIARRIIKENFTLSDDEYSTIEAMNKKAIQEIVKEALSALEDEIQERNVGPVMRAVASLPKEDMAKLAEALVEVTALKKKVSPSVESVGGPIDVCIVTKGDGLIWIKRKHYFDLSKNLQYMSYRKLTAPTLNIGGTE